MTWEMAVQKAQANKRDNKRHVYKVVFTDNPNASPWAKSFAMSIKNRIFSTRGKAKFEDIYNLETTAIWRQVSHERVVSEAISKGLVTIVRLA